MIVGLGKLSSVGVGCKLVVFTANLSTTSTSTALHGSTAVVDGVSVTVTAPVPFPFVVAENHFNVQECCWYNEQLLCDSNVYIDRDNQRINSNKSGLDYYHALSVKWYQLTFHQGCQ